MWSLKLSDSHARVLLLVWYGVLLAFAHIALEIPNIFISLVRNSKHFHVPDYEPHWLWEIDVNHGLDLTNEFGNYFLSKRTGEFLELLYLRNHHKTPNSFRILCTVLRLTPKHSETLSLVFPARMPDNTACRVQICGGANCVMVLLLLNTVLN